MISVTNNVLDFFERNNELEIIIYSAGNTGYWVGYFMNRVGIDFTCYLDRAIKHEGAFLNGKPVYRPEKLSDYKGKSVKIIVCPTCYKEICSDLLWLDRKYGFNALCFVPQYMDFIHHDDRYNINKFLGYFRRQLVNYDIPTIISNNCTAGFLYEALGMMMLSPTINTGFSDDGFIKICREPYRYLSADITDLKWIKRYDQTNRPVENLAGKLLDIDIIFGHEIDVDRIYSRWSTLRQSIKWDNMIFVMEDIHKSVSLETIKVFDSLKEKHLFVGLRTQYGIISDNIVYFKDDWFNDRINVIENNYDLVGWMNRR